MKLKTFLVSQDIIISKENDLKWNSPVKNLTWWWKVWKIHQPTKVSFNLSCQSRMYQPLMHSQLSSLPWIFLSLLLWSTHKLLNNQYIDCYWDIGSQSKRPEDVYSENGWDDAWGTWEINVGWKSWFEELQCWKVWDKTREYHQKDLFFQWCQLGGIQESSKLFWNAEIRWQHQHWRRGIFTQWVLRIVDEIDGFNKRVEEENYSKIQLNQDK